MPKQQSQIDVHDAELKSQLIRSVGTHRADRALSPIEVAHALDYFASASSLKAISKQIGLETSTASRFLRLLSLPSSVQSLVEWGTSATTLSFSVASELASLGSSADQEEAARLALRHKLTKDEVRQAVQVHRRAAAPIGEAISAVLARRKQVLQVDVFIGAVPKHLRSRVAELTQSERDGLLSRQLNEVIPIHANVRMTPQHYTISSETPLPGELLSKLDDYVANRLTRHFNA
ncbi:hypothetical protein [Mycobacterium sp. MFM001]|uniref:hypothetical protein n=1 Tax=Mycobacterium sp. MFM001 TaxID=2049453 RepID=UPI0011598704|nr:hypothetical protein [Mycobacterium sp. MFM001]